MVNENQIPQYRNNNILGVLAGLLIGGLAGAVTMLLLAPQSGKDTRRQPVASDVRQVGVSILERRHPQGRRDNH